MVHCHTVHLALGALLSPFTVCGTGIDVQLISATPILFQWQREPAVAADVSAHFNDAALEMCAGRAAHGALPHRAPPTRCTADLVHHVWYRHLPTTSYRMRSTASSDSSRCLASTCATHMVHRISRCT